jgi:hypothetical protein
MHTGGGQKNSLLKNQGQGQSLGQNQSQG